jgi:hypothetical protein
MSRFVLHTSETAHWYALVSEAEASARCALAKETESYLVLTLMRMTQGPALGRKCLAMSYLEGIFKQGRQRVESLREVGDQCLILAGLFPDHARRRSVPVSYYVRLGQRAYGELAAHDNLFGQLSQAFVSLMDILQNIRESDDGQRCLDPLEAHDLWFATGSHHAYSILREATRALPATRLTHRIH